VRTEIALELRETHSSFKPWPRFLQALPIYDSIDAIVPTIVVLLWLTFVILMA
jgi:hypothetical protein